MSPDMTNGAVTLVGAAVGGLVVVIPQALTKGTRYARWVWVDGRDLVTVKAHTECVAAWDHGEYGDSECERGMNEEETYNWRADNPACCDCDKRFPLVTGGDAEICPSCMVKEADEDHAKALKMVKEGLAP